MHCLVFQKLSQTKKKDEVKVKILVRGAIHMIKWLVSYDDVIATLGLSSSKKIAYYLVLSSGSGRVSLLVGVLSQERVTFCVTEVGQLLRVVVGGQPVVDLATIVGRNH